MNDTAVSVIIPTYNRASLIVRAVCSVLIALAPGDELLVVDDGSTDETRRVLTTFGNRVRVLAGEHRGVGAARNRGLAAATRPCAAFLDSDDEWHSDKLRLQRAFMQTRPDVVFCFSDLGLRYADGRPATGHGLSGWHHDPRGWDEILAPGVPYTNFAPLPPERRAFRVHIGDLYPTMLRVNYVATQSALVRRGLAGDALRFPEDIHIHEDHECFTRLARLGPAAYFDCETAWQWGHDGARLSDVDDEYWATCRLKMLARTFGADSGFLARHGARYRAAVQAEHLRLARCAIRAGQPDAARAELRLAGGGPLAYRALSTLPGPVLRGALGLRRFLRAGGH